MFSEEFWKSLDFIAQETFSEFLSQQILRGLSFKDHVLGYFYVFSGFNRELSDLWVTDWLQYMILNVLGNLLWCILAELIKGLPGRFNVALPEYKQLKLLLIANLFNAVVLDPWDLIELLFDLIVDTF